MSKPVKTKKQPIELIDQPKRSIKIIVLILSLIGIGISAYLYYLHLALSAGEITGKALCGSNNSLGCHAVAASRYGKLFGYPVALLGCVYFFVLFTFAVGSLLCRREQALAYLKWLFILVSGGLLFDVYLAYAMFFKMQVLCPLCLATYVINLFIFIALFKPARSTLSSATRIPSIFPRIFSRVQPTDSAYYENALKGLLLGTIILLGTVLTSLPLVTKIFQGDDKKILERYREALAGQETKEVSIEGRPSFGAEQPTVTAVIFSDFRCPYCKRAAEYVHISAADTRQITRFAFRHFPLDTACNDKISNNLHPGACQLAFASACADQQGKFWKFHDAAFESDSTVTASLIEELAINVGLDLQQLRDCLASDYPKKIVSEDIADATALGVNQTPIIFINGKMLRGIPPPGVFNELLTPE